ncbi:hypothetical protein FOA52_014377 [Chlamydomonas sp. UWO 241]|nr:hypothetical protein FOA52_014377 [Chlamydomonas sp. UWO 241]
MRLLTKSPVRLSNPRGVLSASFRRLAASPPRRLAASPPRRLKLARRTHRPALWHGCLVVGSRTRGRAPACAQQRRRASNEGGKGEAPTYFLHGVILGGASDYFKAALAIAAARNEPGPQQLHLKVSRDEAPCLETVLRAMYEIKPDKGSTLFLMRCVALARKLRAAQPATMIADALCLANTPAFMDGPPGDGLMHESMLAKNFSDLRACDANPELRHKSLELPSSAINAMLEVELTVPEGAPLPTTEELTSLLTKWKKHREATGRATLPDTKVRELASNLRENLELVESGDWDDMQTEKRMEEEVCIRAKWTLDGCNTLDECIERLKKTKAWYRSLQDDGYKLRDTISDDYDFLER